MAAADSFKGSLTSVEVCEVIRQAIVDVLGTAADVRMLPLSDGGEGFCTAVVTALGGTLIPVSVHDPLMRPLEASYGIVRLPASLFAAEGDTVECAVVELAQASGLCLLDADERNPLLTTTFGTGELIRHAIGKGIRHILVGLGGSATNDCGRGLLEALEGVEAVDECTFLVASDVRNPLCGPLGATYVFARQKGATDAMLPLLEERNAAYGRWLGERCGHDVASLEGAGAAGGTGAALLSMRHCRTMPGIDLLLQLYRADEQIEGASLVITGEGCIDRQTLMGKAPYGVARAAQRLQVPCVALGGRVRLDADAIGQAPWTDVVEVTPPAMDDDEALLPAVARHNLYEAVKKYLLCEKNDRSVSAHSE